MFYIEIDRVLLEIGANKSELFNLESFSPDKYEIIIISNPKNEEDANTIKEELSNRDGPYHQYTFKVFTTEIMPEDEVRITLGEMNPKAYESVYMPHIKYDSNSKIVLASPTVMPVTNVALKVDEQHLKKVGIIIGAKNSC